nr:MAG TPA: hypothetical protein [Caudoviricetes sp.]DAI28675.1 MAG TPA: hypothetical protein [Caudoviricetes sp.]
MLERNPSGPCKDCPERRVDDGYNCHSVCSKYLAFLKVNEAAKQERQKLSAMEAYYIRRNHRRAER